MSTGHSAVRTVANDQAMSFTSTLRPPFTLYSSDCLCRSKQAAPKQLCKRSRSKLLSRLAKFVCMPAICYAHEGISRTSRNLVSPHCRLQVLMSVALLVQLAGFVALNPGPWLAGGVKHWQQGQARPTECKGQTDRPYHGSEWSNRTSYRQCGQHWHDHRSCVRLCCNRLFDFVVYHYPFDLFQISEE